MRASIGGLSLFNIFIVFFIIVAFLLTGAVTYYKGYKVNSGIIKALEMYEGYNSLSADEINRTLTAIGYRKNGKDNVCGSGPTGVIECQGEDRQFDYKIACSYDSKNHGDAQFSGRYISYKVTTYIYIDLPLGLPTIKLPISARTNPIYQFTGFENGMGCFGR